MVACANQQKASEIHIFKNSVQNPCDIPIMLDTGWIIGILVIRLNIICIWLGSMIPKISQNICKHHQGFGHCWSQSATARGTSKSHLANCSQGPASPTFNSWSQWLLLHESLHWHTDRGTTSVPYPDQAGFNVKNGNRNFGIQLILWMLEKSARSCKIVHLQRGKVLAVLLEKLANHSL